MVDCRLICSDVDGTLVNSELKISKDTNCLIRRVVTERDVPFALVSGRFRSGMTFLREDLGIDAPLCCFNGAYVEIGGEIVVNNPITVEQARKVLFYSSMEQMDNIIFDLDNWYMEQTGYWYDRQVRMSHSQGTIVRFDTLLDNWEKTGHVFYKILPKSEDPAKVKRLESILQYALGDELEIFSSSPYIVETAFKGTSKAKALVTLTNYYRIKPSQVMAFGDYDNDEDMLKACGYPVAMGNGTDKVKKLACYVTDDNDHDGIAHALRHFFFK
ncbi:MAG: HAD family hydrolase [Sphaerochaetaceae bacterium]